jgi:hypothetical protein
MGFNMTMLTGRGTAYIYNLAGATLDEDVAILAQTGAKHGESHGRAGIRRLKAGVFLGTVISIYNHFDSRLGGRINLGPFIGA